MVAAAGRLLRNRRQPRSLRSAAAVLQRPRVAARDLEAGLRAALEAQRSLQARKRRRDKLLRALSKVAHSCCRAAPTTETAL